ncbi:MAG: TlpA family protein disulfide reductase [Bacteroides sp.]|nr:TlpA family protein disulfide reductase [Bacteroides sp.]
MNLYNSLFMFLLFLCLGTPLSAQTGKTAEVETWTLINNYFFRTYPESIKDKVHSISFVAVDGKRIMVVNLKSGEILSEEEMSHAVSINEIPDGHDLLETLKLGHEPSKVVVAMSDPFTKASALKVGEGIPEFSATDTKGILWNKESILGKPTVLNFWYIGCAPCIREMPDLNEWMEEVPEVNYLSVTWNTAQQIESIVTQTPFLFHHLTDNLFLFQLFAVQITPTTILLDKVGTIREIVVGTSDEKRAHLLSQIKRLAIE